MTVDSSMSSGYCSLEEELEDCFFTAKTTFFRNVQTKQTPKNVCKPPEETQRPPTLQEIKQKIDSYNTREKNCLGMKLVRRAAPIHDPGHAPGHLGSPAPPLGSGAALLRPLPFPQAWGLVQG